MALAAAMLLLGVERPQAQQTVANDVIQGAVASAKGAEAGVWVIAETTDLPTRFIKIVVTDDQGRYVLPELPKANYDIWVRGYGLADSAKTTAAPGTALDLKAVLAKDDKEAAQVYPAQYWYSMLKIPEKNLFPGTGPNGNGMPVNQKSQGQWLATLKTLGCNGCHQLGNKATRVIEPELGTFKSSFDAWEHRLQVGPSADSMVEAIGLLDTRRAIANFAEWTDRIAAGEIPKNKPTRPQGVERNVVVTMWDWGDAKTYLHDEVATDKRNPTVNAYGKIYSATEDSTDMLPVLDPKTNSVSYLKSTPRDPDTPDGSFIGRGTGFVSQPSPYWGSEKIWKSQTTVHNPMFDAEGRVWLTSRIRKPQTPAFCQAGSEHPSAKLFPMKEAGRQVAMYDPKTDKLVHIDTCFTTHHLIFAEDANNTMWLSGGGARQQVVGWINTKKYLETGDAAASQGWTAMILDTNGNGKRDDYVEPNQPVDPTKDKRIIAGLYGIGYDPNDGTIWGSVHSMPGGVVHIIPGDNPPATTLAEYYEVPFKDPRVPVNGFGPRGGDIDRNGVFWAPLASGHLASFDRKKCKGPLNGPAATGKHCPEGWTLYQFPGPQFENIAEEQGAVQSSYQAWVDQFDTFGLGKNVPIGTGNLTDSLEALVNGKFVTLRVPYPMGFHAKGLDGRIDDANAGWKGRALWSTYAGRAPYHMETGKGSTPKAVKFQLRPDPLAH
jgi:hypothetical protein